MLRFVQSTRRPAGTAPPNRATAIAEDTDAGNEEPWIRQDLPLLEWMNEKRWPRRASLSHHGAALNPHRDANSTPLDLMTVERWGYDRCVTPSVSAGLVRRRPGESYPRALTERSEPPFTLLVSTPI
jgi:hypothetical protein